MALMTAPRTPSVAVARELRRLGLGQGAGKDFRILGHYVNKERRYTHVELLNAHARRVVADNADTLERWTAASNFPFTVSVRYFDGSPNPWPTVRNGGAERIRDEAPAAVEEAPAAPAADVEVPELWNGVPGIIAGPGVVVPGVHVECLPQHRPGPRTRYAHGGVIQSVGTTCVRWRPYGYDKDIRTPLEHMRVDACSHINMREDVNRMIAALDAGERLPKNPEWCHWTLAQHIEYAAAQAEAVEAQPEATAPVVTGPVVVIPCGATKLGQAAPAGQLYTGSYHRACARAAAALTADGGTVLILSALYGLTPMDRVIEPYELRMGEPGSVTGEQLREQARALGTDRAREVVILAGATYTAAAKEVWPEASTPLAGLGGMGYQLQRLAALAAGKQRPVTDFRTGDIVTVDGRPGDWELMAPAGDGWDVEPARSGDRERTTVPAAVLRPLPDAPRVRRGDLVVQSYAEQERSAVVSDVYRLGRWVAVKTYAATEHAPAWTQLGDVEHLTVVTAHQVESAVRLNVVAGEHRGRILQAIVTGRAGQFRVTCQCARGMEICRTGRQVGWSSSLEAARELWEWHAAGCVGPAPADRVPSVEAPAPAPTTETPQEDVPTLHAPAEPVQIPAQAAPVISYREQYRQEEQAKHLQWSTRHADAVAWAAAGELVRAEDGTPRRVAPGQTGRRVAAALLPPLVNAGFLADVERDGVTRVEPTADGRSALQVWGLYRPEPVERPRKKEGLPLTPLRGGQEARRRSDAFQADEKRRRAERDRWYAEAEQRRAAEEREDRLREVWVRVEGILNPFSRRPKGWAPNVEQAAAHRLDPALVAALREEAAAWPRATSRRPPLPTSTRPTETVPGPTPTRPTPHRIAT